MVLRRGSLSETLLAAAATNTPLRRVEVTVQRTTYPIWLKLEMHNPAGSVKYRTALGLLAALDRRQALGPATRLVESSSGNLGVALAQIAQTAGWRFTAVVDPKTPPPLRELMASRGADLVMVDEVDDRGGYLLNRLAKVRELMLEDQELRWTDQYHSRAGAWIHESITAPELLRQTSGGLDAIFAAVSTGGTIAGLCGGLRRQVPQLPVYAIDVEGSIATGGASHPHLLSGIGATRRSTLVQLSSLSRIYRIDDVTAIAMCRLFRQQTGLDLGASSGAVLGGFSQAVAEGLTFRAPVLISPDGGSSYEATIYSDEWLLVKGALAKVEAAMVAAQDNGVSFRIAEEVTVGDGKQW